MKNFFKKFEPAIWAGLGFWLFGQGLDILSTVAVAPIPGIIESNEYMRDPVTLKFILWKGLAVKGASALVGWGPLAYTLKKCYNHTGLAMLPFIYSGYRGVEAGFGNLLIIWSYLS